MNKFKPVFIFLILVVVFPGYSLEEKRQLQAVRTSDDIKIDGILDESSWEVVPVAADFITYSPSMGDPAYQKSEVMVVYNDQALYIGAYLFDTHPDSILAEYTKRDNVSSANTDRFKISLNPYNDGQNIYEFEVSAANVQADSKITVSNSQSSTHYGRGDSSWNAVWESAVQMADDGWIVEIKIPYSAIRFPKTDVQTWGLNFWRTIRRIRETSTWNPVDRNFAEEDQNGELIGIDNIQAPIRLELYPFAAGYYQVSPGGNGASYAAGMDLKYGINEAYTLDMTLIPDFGQRKSDDIVLNLTPYEVKYRENRQFFTEGLEIFDKSGLFYSRRIGKQPQGFYDANEIYNDSLASFHNPEEARLINATKVSGRNHNNLGMGFLNAMTANTYAKYRYPEMEEEKFLTEPFTNFNMLVVDQIIGRNSFVNIANTNVFRPSDGLLANVTGATFKFADKENMYNVSGKVAYSTNHEEDETAPQGGYLVNIGGGKYGGSFNANYNLSLLSDNYDPNRMGYLSHNNAINHDLSIGYRVLEPFSVFNNMSHTLSLEYNQLFAPREYSKFEASINSRVLFRDHSDLRLSVSGAPAGMQDWYEPRVSGWFYKRPASIEFDLSGSSDYRKRLAFNSGFEYGMNKGGESSWEFNIMPRIRVNDKLSVYPRFQFEKAKNQIGYAGYVNADTIAFGKRMVDRVTNQLTSTYVFNNKSALSLSMRHYWSAVDYKEYYVLQKEGSLVDYPDYAGNEDLNFNIFTVDLEYSWNFSPGSFLTVVWKNNILVDETVPDDLFMSYWENFEYTIKAPQTNSFSVKMIYYLDYHSVVKPRLTFPR